MASHKLNISSKKGKKFCQTHNGNISHRVNKQDFLISLLVMASLCVMFVCCISTNLLVCLYIEVLFMWSCTLLVDLSSHLCWVTGSVVLETACAPSVNDRLFLYFCYFICFSDMLAAFPLNVVSFKFHLARAGLVGNELLTGWIVNSKFAWWFDIVMVSVVTLKVSNVLPMTPAKLWVLIYKWNILK